MKSLFLNMTFIIYLTSWIGSLFYFKTLEKKALKILQKILLVGLVFHFIYLSIIVKEVYLTSLFTFSDVLVIFSFLLVIVYFYFALGKEKAYTLATFFLPFPLFILSLNILLSEKNLFSPFSPYIKSLWFPLHIITSLLSHAFLIAGLVASIMYLLQEKEIKKKHFGYFFRKLPPLHSLERIAEKSLYKGFFLLTLGIISGVIWSELAFGDYWRWSAKEMISLALWLIYAGMIHQRILIGWRGKRLAYMFVIGGLLWFFTFFIINFKIKGFHTYGSAL